MAIQDYYEILQVSPDADSDTICAAYRRLRDQYNPEKLSGAGTELEFVIMVIAVSCVKLLSAHNSTQHTSRKHKV
jgi:DnaJ-class molecular chaperone with C-terminal Zn finger domain